MRFDTPVPPVGPPNAASVVRSASLRGGRATRGCDGRITPRSMLAIRSPRGLALACAVTLACTPGPRVESAAEIGIVGQNSAINGRDGGSSSRVFGKSVWTYGDTTLTFDDEQGQTWHHNSVSWTEDTDAADGLAAFTEPVDSVGAPAYFVLPTAAEQAFNEAHWDDGDCEEPCGARYAVWPGNPLWDEQNQRAILLYGLIYAEPGDFNFEGRGSSVATWSSIEAPVERPIIDANATHPDLIWDETEPGIGAAAAIDGDYLYAFACEQEGLGRPCFLVRAPLDGVQEHAAWRWWDGAYWLPTFAAASRLFEGAPIMSLSYNQWLDAWLIVYSSPLDGTVYGRTAPALTGPWSEPAALYDPPADTPYDTNHHAEFDADGGRTIYATYSRPYGDRWFATEFPLIEIRFAE